MQIDVRHNFGDIGKMLERLAFDVQDKVLPQTLNTLVNQAARDMATQISSEFNVTRSEVAGALRIDKATAKAGRFYMTARLSVAARPKGRGFNLIRFVEKKVTFAEARRRAKSGTLAQLRVKIKRTGGMKVIPGAFIGNNGRTVFRRVGKARLPIKALTTIDTAQMFMTRRIHQVVVAKIKANASYVLRDTIANLIKGREWG